jgi:hypothetical protein
VKRLAWILVFLLVAGACGGTQATEPTPPPIEDLEAAAERAGKEAKALRDEQEASAATSSLFADLSYEQAVQKATECGVRPPPPPGAEEVTPPEPYASDPFGQAANDFPMAIAVTPTEGDRGTDIHARVISGRPQTRVVFMAMFVDQQNHGILQARRTDLTGVIEFDAAIPDTAPVGLGMFIAAGSWGEDSALATAEFTVTGPGCP